MKMKKTMIWAFVALFIAINFATVVQNTHAIGTHTFICYGYVKDINGNAIYDATVTIRGGDPDTGIYVSTKTSSTGYYTFTIQTSYFGYCQITASKTGYEPQTKSVYSSNTVRVDFALEIAAHSFIVKGTVYDTYGNKLVGATVRVYGSGIDKTDTTDSNGEYYISMSTKVYDTITIYASKDDFVTQYKSVYTSSTRTVDFDLNTVYYSFVRTDVVTVATGGIISLLRYHLEVRTEFKMNIYNDGYITAQRNKLYGTRDNGFAPGFWNTFCLSYLSADGGYWRGESPVVYEYDKLTVTGSGSSCTIDYDYISNDYGKTNTLLRFQCSYSLDGNIFYDRGGLQYYEFRLSENHQF